MSDFKKIRYILDEHIVSEIKNMEQIGYEEALEKYYASETYRFLNEDEKYGLSRLGGISLAIRVLGEPIAHPTPPELS